MSLQQFLDSYHHDTTGDYNQRIEKARCFVCDACLDPIIKAATRDIYAFASHAFRVHL